MQNGVRNNHPADKHERFRRVAARRTKALLQKLQILGNCSNRQTYNYTDQEVTQMFQAIEEQLSITKARFEKKRNVDFRFE